MSNDERLAASAALPPSWAEGLAGRKVLVTGAGGFLGAHLCRRLRAAGVVLHGVSRSRSGCEADIHWWRAHLENQAAVHRLLTEIRPEAVVHLGGMVSASPDAALVLPTFHSLLTSAVNILAAALEIDCRRIILVGSLEEPQTVDPAAAPASPYGAAKWAASAYGRMFHALYRSPVVIVRLYMTYGPGQNPSKIVPYAINCLLRGEPLRISSGREELDWVYVDDAVDGMARALAWEGIDGSTIELGSGTTASVRSVVERLAAMLDPGNKPMLGVVPDRPPKMPRVADVAATYRQIKWRPQTPLDQGLERTIEWYRRQLTAPAIGAS